MAHIHLCLQNVQNKLFPILVKLPNFLSLEHIFKLSATPKWKGHDFIWENYTVMPPMRINCYAQLWHLVLKKGRKFCCQKESILSFHRVMKNFFYLRVLLHIRYVISDKIASLVWFCFGVNRKHSYWSKKLWPMEILE